MSSLTALDLTDATNAIARAVITAAMQAVTDAFDRAIPVPAKRATTTTVTLTVPPGGWANSTAEPAGAAKRGRPEKVPGRLAKIIAAHCKGDSAPVIAKRFGVSVAYVGNTVYRARIKDPSIPKHKQGRPRTVSR